VLGGSEDVFVGGEQVLNKWRDSTAKGCDVQIFEKAGHFYWKHSDEYEDMFLECIMEKLFPAEPLQFDENFLEVATSAGVILDDDSLGGEQ
jgi:hypothetical protein